MTNFIQTKYLTRHYGFKTIFIISFLVGLCNLLTIKSIVGIFITFVEIWWVIYLLIHNKKQDALIWHLIFIVLSISAQGAAAINDGQISLYNYAELKIFGPIRFSYVITILIWLVSKRRISCNKHSILMKLLRFLLFIAVTGDIIGILGITLSQHYSIDAFISYNVYIWIVILTLDTILKNNHIYLIKTIYRISIPLLCGAIIASMTGMFLGISTNYGGHDDLPMTLDIFYYCPLLILSILYVKRHIPLILSCIAVLFILVFLGASGGKSVFIIAISLVYLGFRVFTINNNISHIDKQIYKHLKYLKCIVIVLFIGIGAYLPKIMSDGDSMTGYKIASAISIFSGNIDDVSRSPAIRIAETANIFYNSRNNPFYLLFGRGYGGYFTDELGLFIGLEVWKGGWNEKIVSSGRYPTAHDTFAVVPLCNGIVGIILILYMSWLFITKIKTNYLNFAAIPWLLLTFYFSTLCAIIGIFFLVGGQFDIDNELK